MPLGLGFFATAGAGGAPTAAYELIETTVLSGNTASVSFSSIPQTFRHLQIRITARTSTSLSENSARRIATRFNGISSSSYSSHELFGNGNNVFSQAATNQTYLWAGYTIGDTATTGIFATSVLDILDYTSSSKNKTTRTLAGIHGTINANNNNINLQSGAFLNTAAITEIQLLAEGALTHGFQSGSRFSLYGIRG
jgi:hypothetical protein